VRAVRPAQGMPDLEAGRISGGQVEVRARTGLRETRSIVTLWRITYVVQSRSNTVGILRGGTGEREGPATVVEPGRTSEDRSPRVVPSLRGLFGNRGAGHLVPEILPPNRLTDVAQDLHRSYVEGRSLPRFAS
jgi:hypothetical protein